VKINGAVEGKQDLVEEMVTTTNDKISGIFEFKKLRRT